MQDDILSQNENTHVFMKIAGGVQYMICDRTNSVPIHFVLAHSQSASPNYNI